VVHKGARDWRLIDIGLRPGERSRGLGSVLIAAVQSACAAAGAEALNLHVDVGNNRARALYERLGFCISGDIGTHAEMAWRPAPRVGNQLKTAS
jgi:ribosomal protein S18 acetylase RimI-like enzyme